VSAPLKEGVIIVVSESTVLLDIRQEGEDNPKFVFVVYTPVVETYQPAGAVVGNPSKPVDTITC
jgi:hypothetical protein